MIRRPGRIKSDVPLYEIVRRRILEMIEEEHLSILPDEPALQVRLQVGRNTLRHAIADLAKEKIVQPIRGIGTIVHPAAGLKEECRVLLIYDFYMHIFQREILLELLFMLGKSKLHANVLMVDKEHVDGRILEAHLKSCDAVIIDANCSFSPVIRELVARCGKKRVCLRWDATANNLSSVVTDLELGIYLLLKHLLELGHRKFMHLGVPFDLSRNAGFARALSEYGLDMSCIKNIYREHWITANEREYGMEYATEAFARRTDETAIIANNDCIALCAEELAWHAGLRIPEDISVVGFDNIADSAFFPVPLTTCSANKEEMVQEAISYLFSSQKPTELFCKKIMPKLVIRQSTGPVKQ